MQFPWEQGLVKSVVDYFECMVLECEPIREEKKSEQKVEK